MNLTPRLTRTRAERDYWQARASTLQAALTRRCERMTVLTVRNLELQRANADLAAALESLTSAVNADPVLGDACPAHPTAPPADYQAGDVLTHKLDGHRVRLAHAHDNGWRVIRLSDDGPPWIAVEDLADQYSATGATS